MNKYFAGGLKFKPHFLFIFPIYRVPVQSQRMLPMRYGVRVVAQINIYCWSPLPNKLNFLVKLEGLQIRCVMKRKTNV